MENLKAKIAAAPRVRLGELIEIDEEINSKNLDLPFYGVNKDKEFMPTIANTDGLKKNKYKIIRKGQFIFSGMQTGRDMCVRFALYDEDAPVLVSPAYTTLRLKSDIDTLAEYIFVYFLSSERDRLGAFYSDASVRANLELYRFFEIEIPLPGIEVQKAIAALYRCGKEAQRIANKAQKVLNSLWPALVQWSSNHQNSEA